MKKLFTDLLKAPTGKYGRKSFITIVFTFFSVGVGIYAAVKTNPKDVFDSSLVFLGVLIGTTVADKKIASQTPTTTE